MRRWLLISGFVALLGSCSGEVDRPSQATAQAGAGGTAGGACTTGVSGTAGQGGTAGTGPNDVAVLQACTSAEPCERSLAQLIEGAVRNVTIDRAICLMNALGERTVGRYLHDTDSTFSNGSVGANHALLIDPDGTARYARNTYSLGEQNTEPGQRCALKPASYFASCREALEATPPDMALGWPCVFGDGGTTTWSTLDWFESCTTESPLSCD